MAIPCANLPVRIMYTFVHKTLMKRSVWINFTCVGRACVHKDIVQVDASV